VPSGNGYTKIYSTNGAFAALKADGSITAWGSSNSGGISAPSGNGDTKIYSTDTALSVGVFSPPESGPPHALNSFTGGGNTSSVPTDKGYIKIYSTATAFAALKADGYELVQYQQKYLHSWCN
jgi:hypothetical protein